MKITIDGTIPEVIHVTGAVTITESFVGPTFISQVGDKLSVIERDNFFELTAKGDALTFYTGYGFLNNATAETLGLLTNSNIETSDEQTNESGIA
jgi:hypothetical protein